MPAVPTQGFLGWVKVSTSPSPTNKISGLTDVATPYAANQYDASNMDAGATNGWEQFLPGLKGGKPALKLVYDPTDTNGQLVLRSAWVAGTLLYFIASINGTDTATFTAFVANWNPHAPVNGANDLSVNLQMTGPVVFA